jgi:hypothetical protein
VALGVPLDFSCTIAITIGADRRQGCHPQTNECANRFRKALRASCEEERERNRVRRYRSTEVLRSVTDLLVQLEGLKSRAG